MESFYKDKRKNFELREYIQKLEFNNHILEAQQELSLDGILVVDEHWRMISYNKRFVSMWDIPHHILKMRDDRKSIEAVLGKLKNPKNFINRIEELMKSHEEFSRDELELKDGRFFDRYSAPIYDKKNNIRGRVWFFRDITELKKARENLERQNEKLEKCVIDRTRNLEKANCELAIREKKLHESNVVLRNLLHTIEKEKQLIKEKISANLKYAILPLISDLHDIATSEQQITIIESIDSLIKELSSEMNFNLLATQCPLTPTEVKVANLIKQGKMTKDIAYTLGCSTRTIGGHRASIRKKLGLHRRQNLQTTLLALDNTNPIANNPLLTGQEED